MQPLLVTTILLVVSSASGYIRLSSLNKTDEAAVSTTTTTTPSPSSSSITENPWEETLVYGDNEVSKNQRANDRFLENNKIRLSTKKKQSNNNSSSLNSIASDRTGNRNKRQHEFVVTKLNDSDHVLHNVQKTILNVEKVINNVEKAINKINKDDGKMEHRGESENNEAKNTQIIFKASPTDDSRLTKTRIARQGVSPNNVYLNSQNYQQQPRIVNRPAYTPSYVNPQPAQSYNNFRPMTSVGNRLANYVTPNSQFVTGNPSYSTPTANYYTPNNQPYAGNPYSPADFSFPQQQQQQYQQPQQQYVQPQPQYQQPQYIPQQTYTPQQVSYPQPVVSYPQQQQQQPYYPPQQPIYQPQPQPIPVYSQPQPQPQPQQFFQPQPNYQPTYQQPQDFPQQQSFIPNNYPTTSIHNRLPVTINNHIAPNPQRLPITIHVPYDNSAYDSKYSPRITRRPQRDAPKINVNANRSSPPFTIRTTIRESSTPILTAIANKIRGPQNSRSDNAHPDISVNFYNKPS